MRRYLETFFRHPWLYLLPLMLVLVGSAMLARRAVNNATPYLAEATIAVNLDPTRAQSLAEQPIAKQHAELLGELLETDGFLLGAIEQITPEASLAQLEGTDLANAIRGRWEQAPVGPNTLRVSFTCFEPAFCTAVVAGVLEAYRNQVIAAGGARESAAVAFYQRQIQATEERLAAIAPTDPAYVAARETYETLITKLIEAGVEESLALQTRQEGFKVLAPPHIPGDPRNPLLTGILPLGLGAAVGLGLTLGLIALVTWLDRSARTPADVFDRLGLQTVAMVPPGWTSQSPFGELRPVSQPAGLGANGISKRHDKHGSASGERIAAVMRQADGNS